MINTIMNRKPSFLFLGSQCELHSSSPSHLFYYQYSQGVFISYCPATLYSCCWCIHHPFRLLRNIQRWNRKALQGALALLALRSQKSRTQRMLKHKIFDHETPRKHCLWHRDVCGTLRMLNAQPSPSWFHFHSNSSKWQLASEWGLESNVLQRRKASSSSTGPRGCTTTEDPRISGAALYQHPAAVTPCLTSGPERKRWLSLVPFFLHYVHCLADAFPHTK